MHSLTGVYLPTPLLRIFWSFIDFVKEALYTIPSIKNIQKWETFGGHTARNGLIIEPWWPYSKLFRMKKYTSKCIYFPGTVLVFSRGEGDKVTNILLKGRPSRPVLDLSGTQHCPPCIWCHLWRWETRYSSFGSPFPGLSNGTPIGWTILHRSWAMAAENGPIHTFLVRAT